MRYALVWSQSPDEDSLSSDPSFWLDCVGWIVVGLNPLTRIHCLPTQELEKRTTPDC